MNGKRHALKRREKTGILCSCCGSSATDVTRTTRRRGYVRRVRQCMACRAIFTTVESCELVTHDGDSALVATNLKKALTAFGIALENFQPDGRI